jgi:hypothetical protein
MFSELDPEELNFIVFLLFSHGDLLIDGENTNIAKIESFLDKLLKDKILRFPYLYGRVLYDRAFELFHHPRELDRLETSKLVESTPQGLCQYGRYLAGGAGLLVANQPRLVSPEYKIPLWHCDSVMCGILHETVLEEPHSNLTERLKMARAILHETVGAVDGPLEAYMERLSQYERYYDDFWAVDLFAFLGNGFSPKERIAISTRVLEKYGKQFRRSEQNRSLRGNDNSWKTPSDNDCGAVALQFALLAADDEVVSCVDELVLNKTIYVPETETRTGVVKPPKTWQGLRSECSNLGFRLLGSHTQLLPLARLKRLVLTLNAGKDPAGVMWALRKVPGKSLGEKVENFIITQDPIKVIERFVLENPDTVAATLKHLHATHINLPDGDDQEKQFLNIILWKLGFPKTTFRSPVESFRSRLSLFRDTAAAGTAMDEHWKEQVRSVGVNLFVSLEEALDRSLAFCTWLLLSDQIQEKHSFNLRAARALAAKELSGLITTDRGPVEFKSNGKNTLFALGTSFGALYKRATALLLETPMVHQKPDTHIAIFARNSKLQIFPFRHTHFIFDMEDEDRKRTLEILQHVNNRIVSTRVLNVRNNIPHVSELFPSRDEIKECCQILEDLLNDLEQFGLMPTVFVTASVENDSWRRRKVRALDYKGREVMWSVSPSTTCLHNVPPTGAPQIIVPSIRLPETAEPMRVAVHEDSDFSEIWSGFPKRKLTNMAETFEANLDVDTLGQM